MSKRKRGRPSKLEHKLECMTELKPDVLHFDGEQVVILDAMQFLECLPVFFKLRSFESFRRRLNAHGFRRNYSYNHGTVRECIVNLSSLAYKRRKAVLYGAEESQACETAFLHGSWSRISHDGITVEMAGLIACPGY